MAHSKHEHTSGITWMLHSAQVDDATLAEALVSGFYAGLYAFALALSHRSHLASAAGQSAIAQAVSGRHRFWGETSLRAWLYRLIYLHIQKDPSQRQSSFSFRPLAVSTLPATVNPSLLQGKPQHFELDDPLPFLLSYGHGLAEEDIAYVLGEKLSDLRSRLNRSRLHLYAATFPPSKPSAEHLQYLDLLISAQRETLSLAEQAELDRHITGCPFCQEFRSRLPALEKAWREQLKPALLQSDQVRDAMRQINSIIYGRTNERKHLLPVKEISLVIVLLLSLILFGRSQGVLRRPIPALLTPSPQLYLQPNSYSGANPYTRAAAAGIEWLRRSGFFYLRYLDCRRRYLGDHCLQSRPKC
jgi:hypothetical protein